MIVFPLIRLLENVNHSIMVDAVEIKIISSQELNVKILAENFHWLLFQDKLYAIFNVQDIRRYFIKKKKQTFFTNNLYTFQNKMKQFKTKILTNAAEEEVG